MRFTEEFTSSVGNFRPRKESWALRKGTGTNFPLRSRRAVPRATRKPAAWNTDPSNSLDYERGVSLWFGVKFRRVLAVFCLVLVPLPLQPLPSAAAGAPNGRQPPGPGRRVLPSLPLLLAPARRGEPGAAGGGSQPAGTMALPP